MEKSIKRLLSLVMVVLMVISMVPTTVFAAESYVAEVNGTQYETVEAAVEAAAEGQTVTLLADIAKLPTISKPITIDGANHKVAAGYGEGQFGTVNGTVTIKNVIFSSGNEAIRTDYLSADYTNLELVIEGCTFDSLTTYAIMGGKSDPDNHLLKGLTVKDCTFNTSAANTNYMVYAQCVGTLKVEGCTFNGGDMTKGAIHTGDSTVYATVATVSGNTIAGVARGVQVGNRVDGSSIAVDGNTFSKVTTAADSKSGAIYVHSNANAETTNIAITNNKINGSDFAVYNDKHDNVAAFVTTFTSNTVDGTSVTMDAATGEITEDTASAVSGTLGSSLVNMSDSAETFISAEITGLNATKSVVIKLYSGETQIATTTLKKTDYFTASTLGVKIIITGESSSWETVWAEGMPCADVVPDKMALFVDGQEMNTANVPMISTDGEQAVNWAEVPGVKAAAPTADLTISTAEELIAFAKDVNENKNGYSGKLVVLAADIDLTGSETNLWTPIGASGDSEPKFRGTFDGQGHTIKNLYVKQGAAYHAAGLFGATNGTIRNLTIDGAYVESLSSGTATVNGTAVVAGSTAYGATIDNVHVKNATVKGNRYVAGIVGYMDGTVTNCSVENVTIVATPDDLTGSYDNGDKVGGIVGYCNSNAVEISGCELKGTVNITAYRDVAGLVGCASTGVKINDNTNSAQLTVTVDQITNSYGEKTANAGEFIGRNTPAEVTGNTTAEGASYTEKTASKPKVDTLSYGFTKEVDGYVRVWGEAYGCNASESFVLELYSGETLMATTELNNVGNIIDGDIAEITWNFFYPESNDEYWTTTWEEGHPNSAAQPDKVVLYVDGVNAAENDVQMNGADDLNPVKWEELGGVAPAVTYVAEVNGTKYESLRDAITAAQSGDTVTILAGTYTGDLTVNKGITVVGETDAEGKNLVTINGRLRINADGATVKNLNVDNGSDTAASISAKDVLVEGCSVVGGNGFRYCYTSGTVTFKDSTITGSTYGIHFDGNAGGNIVIDNCVITGWTSFAGTITNVAIKDTTFAEGNYNQLRFYQDATLTNCTFPEEMSIDFGKNEVELEVTGCTVEGGGAMTDIIYLPDLVNMGVDVTVDGEPVVIEATIGDDCYFTLADAIEAAQAGDEVKILAAGTYAVPTGKDLTITGAVDGVVFDNIGAKNMGGANVTFNNVTFDYYPNVNYTGLQHSGNLVYNNCTINGQVFLYGASETFSNCTFNQNSADAYNVWTYGAKEVAFNECTFNSAGKSVLIYSEQADLVNNVTVDGCEFVATSAVDGKAAIEMDSSLTSGINLTITGSTAKGFANGSVSGNSLWNNKKGSDTDANNDITVVVNGETVLAPVTFVAQIGETTYTSLADAIEAAQDGDTVKLLTDVTVEGTWNCCPVASGVTIDGDGYTLKIADVGHYESNSAFYGSNYNVQDLTVERTGTTATGANAFSMNGGRAYNVTVNGGFGSGIVAAGGVEVDSCTFNNTTWGIYAEPGKTVSAVTNSTFNSLRAVALYGGETFTGNTVNGDKGLSVATTGATVTGNTFTGERAMSISNNINGSAAITGNKLLNGSVVEVAHQNSPVLSKNYWSRGYAEQIVPDGDVTIGASVGSYYADDALTELVTIYVAEVGGVQYATFPEALAAANDGDTITILADFTLKNEGSASAYTAITKDVTVDLNGKTIQGTGHMFRIEADVTFKNGTVDSEWMGYTFRVGNGESAPGNLTIESGTYIGQTHTVYVSAGTVTILGGDFSVVSNSIGTTQLINCYDSNYNSGAAKVEIKGGTFHGFNPADNAAEGANTNFCAEGFAPVSDGNGNYSVHEAPNATVTVLDPLTLTPEEHDYMVWPSGDDTIDRPLEILMNFKANETLEEAKAGGFGKWKTDFYITVTGIEGGSLTANGCYLAGNYGSYGWIVIPMDGVVIQEGVANPVVSVYDANLTYENICDYVKDFTAAIHVDQAILDANPNMKIELALRMTNPNDAADVLTVGEPAVYTVDDLTAKVATVTDANGKVTGYATLAEAIVAAQSGDTVKLLADVTVTESIQVAADDDIILDLNGCTLQTDAAVNDTTAVHVIQNLGKLTVTDSVGTGAIISNDCYTDANGAKTKNGFAISSTSGSTLVIDGAKLVGTNWGYALYVVDAGTTLTIKDAAIEGRGAIYLDGGATGTVEDGEFAITVATTNNQDNAVYVGGTSELTINGGTFDASRVAGAQRVAIASLGSSKVTINGGTFDSLTGDIQARAAVGSVRINGGTFQGTKLDERKTDAIYVSGGTFSYDPDEYCAPGYEAVTEGGTTWAVQVDEDVIAWNMQTGAEYETAAEALLAAGSGETVQLLADSDESGAILTVLNGITLDLNGHTLTARYVFTTTAGSYVVDSTNGDGLLAVAKDNLVMAVNSQIMVWIEELGGYRFTGVTFTAGLINSSVTGGAQFAFWLNETYGIVMEELADGADDKDGLSIQVKMTYTNSQGGTSTLYFDFPAELVQQYAYKEYHGTASYLYMNISGLDEVSDVSFAAVVKNGSVLIESTAVPYEG